ncbi:MAG: SDR family NAD(P)-dependent oxidoreductase [Opitutales bacterium]|nr:SDR family NAD(P)-dependent oxidoreductase [Opitutales bacterium]
MTMKEGLGFLKSYSFVIITGGSSGIGLQFVRRLKELKPELTVFNLSRSKPDDEWGGLEVMHRQTDLSSPAELDEALQWLHAKCAAAPEGKMLLINNSGFGSYGRLPCNSIERQLDMIEVNTAAPVNITSNLLPELKRRGGAIINVCSLAAFQPTPYMATYGATKAFMLNWTLALGQELKRDNVQVQALCPGPTESRFFKNAGFSSPPAKNFRATTAAQVVDASLYGLHKRRRVIIPGWKSRLVADLCVILPIELRATAAEFVLRKLRLETYLKHP